MGERKVVNKFVPWDFDPDKVAKVKLSNIGQFSVRMMLPFTVRCSKCGEFNYQGRKYNTRKETAAGEDYLGIAIQRFYFKCTNCGGEFTIKTDPKNSTYVVESGATRNSYIELNERQLELEEQRQQQEAGAIDTIKALENRTEELRREMDIYDSLDMVLAQTRKSMNTDPEEAIEILRQRELRKKKKEEEEEEAEQGKRDQEALTEYLAIKREHEKNEEDHAFSNAFSKKRDATKPSELASGSASASTSDATKKSTPGPKKVKLVIKKKKSTSS